MKPVPTSFNLSDDEWDDLSIDDRLIEEALAGNFISGDAVKRWIQSWGTPDELPPPQVGD